MSDELKLCPFCGSEYNHGHTADCYFRVRGASDQKREDAWQQRPIEDALRSQIAASNALIDKLVEAGEEALEDLKAGAYFRWQKLVDERRASKESTE